MSEWGARREREGEVNKKFDKRASTPMDQARAGYSLMSLALRSGSKTIASLGTTKKDLVWGKVMMVVCIWQATQQPSKSDGWARITHQNDTLMHVHLLSDFI